MRLKNLTCGNDPEELFHSLRVGTSVFLIPCNACGETLISIRTEAVGVESVVAYFKCTCGKKYRKTVITLDGTTAIQGRVHVVPERIRQGLQGWSNPSRCYVSFDNDEESMYYIVSGTNIRLKKGIPTDA